MNEKTQQKDNQVVSGNALALVSGGMDSAVAAGLAGEAGYRIYALSFDYGQRQRIELEYARKVGSWLGAVEHMIIGVELDKIGGSALTDPTPVPKDRKDPGIPVTYVPARNIIFLAIALAWAEVLSAKRIVIGANAIDFSGYPDCRPGFMEAFQQVAETGTKAGLEGKAPLIWAPLMNMKKAEIVKEGIRLGLDFGMTCSCYDPDPTGKPCLHCDACRLREKGFFEAGIKDPLAG